MGKKSGLMLLCLILILQLRLLTTHAGTDTTAPTIGAVHISGTYFETGDTLKVTVQATDYESGFLVPSANEWENAKFVNTKTGNSFNFLIEFDSTLKMHVGTYKIPNELISGTYRLDSVTVRDVDDNSTTKKISGVSITVKQTYISPIKDTIPPVIESASISGTYFETGDTLTFKVVATDEGKGFIYPSANEFENVILVHTVTRESWAPMIQYDSTQKAHVGKFVINFHLASGLWQLATAKVMDKDGNTTKMTFSDIFFTVKNTSVQEPKDTIAPIINGVSLVGDNLDAGDVLTVTVNATDKGKGFIIPSANEFENAVFFNAKTNQTLNCGIEYDPVKKAHTCSYVIPESMDSGEWKLISVKVMDMDGNTTTKAVSNLGFTVNPLPPMIRYGSNIVLINSAIFDPMEGLEAGRKNEGDLTSKVRFCGEVDVTQMGIYLIKYVVQGSRGYIYRDYRWVSVTDSLKKIDPKTGQLYFSDKIIINPAVSTSCENLTTFSISNGEEVTVVDGVTEITEEGVYEIVADSSTSQSRIRKFLSSPNKESIGGIIFAIDKTAPIITLNDYKTNYVSGPIQVFANTNEGTLNQDSVTFDKNGSFEFIAQDFAGHVTKQTVVIDFYKAVIVSTPVDSSSTKTIYMLGLFSLLVGIVSGWYLLKLRNRVTN